MDRFVYTSHSLSFVQWEDCLRASLGKRVVYPGFTIPGLIIYEEIEFTQYKKVFLQTCPFDNRANQKRSVLLNRKVLLTGS